ncbi:DUF1329 domain-containing protein [Anaeromyxobacter dehalogenans]|uniref:DUF1329 domain-containing protein n=1 Tax=Anaeromyxobacter dehalogenans (strain 2CP-C) TaxID=290397 RepID=Q2IGH5_ANADE|nr:DUF1329 domain-containing protein [Anaeromyxobacter dehalogenans]ABC83684.1 protein of unknown function DUF1329 [Anaeromyxobacter dehalogenans 2CP-C]
MTVRERVCAALLAAVLPAAAPALSPEEARQLGTTLTALGAERAGSADGAIPPYTGGLTTPPPGFVAGSGSRPDPFAAERPLFSIDAASAARHADRLSEGAKALLARYPGFRMDVYPTHRTAAFPPFVTEQTVRAATSAHTTHGGLSVAGVRAAYPFPIPKTGNEAMWNHLVRFNGLCLHKRISAYRMEASGRLTHASTARVIEDYPYWTEKTQSPNVYFRFRIQYEAPARRAGEGFILVDPIDYLERGRRSWQYLPGQRRVRLAPDLAYDTPNAATSGAQTFDDALLFNGAMDRFDFTLVGKKEIYVPYNVYRAAYQARPEELFRKHFANPDLFRWELHRVWVVDARLKPGKRHVYARRVFYLDEDSWAILTSDQYDARGQLWRVGIAFMAPSYDVPAMWADAFLHYDLATGGYGINSWPGKDGWIRTGACPGDAEWSPDALAGSGLR